MKKILIFFLILSVFLPFTCRAQEYATENSENLSQPEDIKPQPEEIISEEIEPLNEFYAQAEVLKINDIKVEEKDLTTQVVLKQEVKLKILNTKLKNQEFTLINEVSTNPLDIKLSQGQKILVNIEEFENEQYQVYIVGYYRITGIILLTILFVVLLILLGGKQGFKTVISLIISILLIFKILIPQILNGQNPLLISLIISLLVAIITLFLIAGVNKKALIAILGTLGGLIFAILISYIFVRLTYLNGLASEEARILFSKFPQINPEGILFSGIIIAALGAVMDVAMSIASSLSEIKNNNKDISFIQLFNSGIRVGKDIIGTMSNTLIFAYVGVSLPLLLLYEQFGDSYLNFINLDFITDEIVRSLGGSIGLIAVIPITAILGAFLYRSKK